MRRWFLCCAGLPCGSRFQNGLGKSSPEKLCSVIEIDRESTFLGTLGCPLFPTQTLTQTAENRHGAKRNNLRVLGDFRPQKAWKALRCSGRRNRQQLITRRSLVQVQPPQPQNRLISQEIRRFFFTFYPKRFPEKLCDFTKFAVDPNRDPYGSKKRPGGGISASGSSFFFEKFLLTYSAAVRTFSMVLAASF